MSRELTKEEALILSKIDALLAAEPLEYSDDPCSDSGGNFDDAYSMGHEVGFSSGQYDLAGDIKRILVARE
jgi:hypothetical protein